MKEGKYKMTEHLFRLFTITGPSGSGKSTLANAAFKHSQQITSFTTRPKRPGEIEGIDYYFISKEKALKLHQEDGCIEFAEYNGNYYGITKEELFGKLARGDSASVVNKEGYENLKRIPELAGKIIPIFIKATKAEVAEHLQTRKDSKAAAAKRLALYDEEAGNIDYFKAQNALIFTISKTKAESQARFVKLIKEHATPRRIAIEGGEGSGKTTLIKLLKKTLPSDQFEYVAEPGTTFMGNLMRREVLYDKDLDKRQQTILFALSRDSINHEVVIPKLKAGKQVIFDRSIFSNLVYQSSNEMSQADILKLNREIDHQFTQPDLVIYLDIDPEVAHRRLVANKRETNFFDEKPLTEQKEWRKKSLKLLDSYRHLLISATDLAQDPDKVLKQIKQLL